MRGIRLAGAALAVAGLVAAACGGTTPTPASSAYGSSAPATQTKTFTIGFTQSQTGNQNVTSKRQTEGIQLWVDDVTKAGGIKLKDGTVLMPQVKFYDDESKTDRVQALYTRLINDDKVDFLLSPYSSGLVKAAAVITEQNGRLMVTAGGADDVTMEQGFKGVYQVYAPGSKYLIGAIDLMLKLGPTQWEPAAKYSAETAKAANVPYFGPTPKEFTDRYVAKYGSQPSYQSSGGYAAGLVLQKALEDAGSTDPQKLQAALDKIDVMLFYGRVKFSLDAKTHGKQIAHDMVYMQWQKGSDGKLATQLVWPQDAATAQAQLRK